MEIKISFDADGTLLARKDIQEYAKELVNLGYDVHIVTQRYGTVEEYGQDFLDKYGITDIENEHKHLFTIADEVGILRDNIHFLNMTDKWIFFKQNTGFIWHLDDDIKELAGLNENTNTIGLSCVGQSTWKHKCNRLIEIWKFNNLK